MNHVIKGLVFPTLPKDLRQYDRDLEQQLRRWSTDTTAQVNSQVQSVGRVLASQPTLALTNAIHHVSGTAQIANIIAPSGFTGPAFLFADGGWSIVTTGNVTFGLTAVVGRCYMLVFDGTLWSPVNVL